MKRTGLWALLAGIVVATGGAMYATAPAKDDPASIEEVMEKAMKNNLGKKVASGKADDKEKMEFLSLMIDLVDNEPPQGDATEWKMMSGKLMMDAARMVVGKEGAGEKLAESMNCKACHDIFKPK